MQEITRTNLVAALAKHGDAILAELTPNKCHLWHMATGIIGEAAELIVADSRGNIIEEIGDIKFYIEGMLQGIGANSNDPINTIALCSIPWLHTHIVRLSGGYR